jgi:hypothetical protein
MEAVWLIPKEDSVVFRDLNGLKTPGMNIACPFRIGMDVFFNMNHFFLILVEDISSEVDIAEINKIITSGIKR